MYQYKIWYANEKQGTIAYVIETVIDIFKMQEHIDLLKSNGYKILEAHIWQSD
jgi:hypothetical protein